MNRLLLVTLSFLMSTCTIAQTLKEGKTWVYDYHHYEDNENGPSTETVFPVSYRINGDTLIDGKSYFKMYQEVDHQQKFYAAYREEGLKVFMRLPLSVPELDKDIIVADFDYEGLYDPSNPEMASPYSNIKEIVDFVEVNGVFYKRHTYYEYDADDWKAIGVEGIGFLRYGLKYPTIYGAEPDCLCDYEVFTLCEEDGKRIFSSSDFVKEGATNGLLSVGEKVKNSTRIYDLSGKQHTNKRPHNIYIQNRQKYISHNYE